MPILKTKLHRPRVPEDYVPRPRLLELLERSCDMPLTLVSAPAGYGKSTLVGVWMDGLRFPGAWLSLNEGDSDLAAFLRYFVAAVGSLAPEARPRTLALISGPSLPPTSVLADELLAELDLMENPFVLVLDDLGFIKEPKVHELLTRILKQNITALHLVLLTRRDPPLPLASLRAGGRMTEIRQAELKFTVDETASFLAKAVGVDVDESAASQLQIKTEGWPGGLRLAALAMDHAGDANAFLRELRGDTRHVQDYLVAEVLSRQPPAVREALLKTSILDRLCAPLCQALCAPECDGQAFMERLTESNLFCVPLDEQGEWLRYHHLFRDLLRRTLERRYGPDEIAALHERAGVWFEENGLIEEALHHALAGDSPAAAGRLVARHRHDLMNREEWHRLRRWIHLIPRDIIEKDTDLLVLQAWSLWNQIRLREMVGVLDQVDTLLSAASSGSTAAIELRGEYHALRSLQHYLGAPCDGTRALAHAREALQRIPLRQHSARGFATIMLAMSCQMTGDLRGAFSAVSEAMSETEGIHTTHHTRLLITNGLLNWVEADLSGLQQAAGQLLDLSLKLDLPESIVIGHNLLGIGHYCRNELDAAEKELTAALEHKHINMFNFAHSAFALALTRQSKGSPAGAVDTGEMVALLAAETANAPLRELAGAFQAELSLRQGKVSQAARWAKTYDPYPLQAQHRFYVPQLTMAKTLMAQGTSESRLQADDLLLRLEEFFSSIHNTRFLIDVHALQALLHDTRGEAAAAMEKLTEAIALAEPGGFLRPFLDLGDPMEDLLGRFCEQNGGSDYARVLLDAFGGEGTPKSAMAPSGSDSLADPLTSREIDILSLLTKRLQNKEIADRLSISPETVRRHTANIYQKLDVHDRRQAVERAHSLRIFPEG
jgi:LuxR family maltose regulon positive regulatory protein